MSSSRAAPTDDSSDADPFADLRRDYAADLSRSVTEICDAARAFVATNDAATRSLASTLAHRLRGTAGSFGFRAVGEAAGALEDALETPLEKRGEATAAAVEALVAAFAHAAEVSS